MSRMVLHEVSILSRKEKAAYSLTLHPEVTVIRGVNDTGKSSLIKTIPWCFGAEPGQMNGKWIALDICAAVRFSVEQIEYTIVRHKESYGLFDHSGKLILATNKVTAVLGPRLGKLFNFNFLLTSRKNTPTVPPPAYYFLPFYFDQDMSWAKAWASFAALNQFTDWKKDLVEYHVGLRSNEFYRLNVRITQLENDLLEPTQHEQYLGTVKQKLLAKLKVFPIDFNLDRFKKEIEDLISLSRRLAAEEEHYRKNLSGLADRKIFLEQQLVIAKHLRAELNEDYKYTIERPQKIDCPTCGAVYENDIVERFGLAFDVERCLDIISNAQAELGIIADKGTQIRSNFEEVRSKNSKIWEILEVKQEAVSLSEMLAGEAHGQAVQALQEPIDALRQQIGLIREQIDALRDRLSKFESKERKASMVLEFTGIFRGFCVSLDVVGPAKISSFIPTLKETGSDLPRLILAYEFAILHMIWRHSDTVHPFIIIDSPNQNDQDQKNLHAMISFIRNNTPQPSQLILGLVDTDGVSFPGDDVVLVNKWKLLSTDLYATVGGKIQGMVETMYDALRAGVATQVV